MLDDPKTAVVKRIVDEIEDCEERVRAVQRLGTSEELQYLAGYYNWDDGLEVPTAIANHPQCDLGLAMNLFWLAEAVSWYTKETETNEYNQAWAKFCQIVTDRIVGGYYPLGSMSFFLGLGVARIHKYRKLGVPEILLTDVVGSSHLSAS